MKTRKVYTFPEVAMEIREDCVNDNVYRVVMAAATMTLGIINNDANRVSDNIEGVEFMLIRRTKSIICLSVRSDKSPSLHAGIPHYWGIDLYVNNEGLVTRMGLVEDRMGHPTDS